MYLLLDQIIILKDYLTKHMTNTSSSSSAPTLNQTLSKAHKEQFKVSLLIGEETYCYEDCVIQYIGRTTITFVCSSFKGDSNVLMSYTIKKSLITGIGFVIAALPAIEDDIDEYWNID